MSNSVIGPSSCSQHFESYSKSMEAAIMSCCCILFSSYIAYVVVSRFAYSYSKDKCGTIRREMRLLDGLVQDFDQVSRSWKQLRLQARQLMEEYSDLNDREKGWISKARKLVYEATRCVQSFQELSAKRNSPKWFFWVLTDMVPMVDVAFRMRRVEKMISNIGIYQTGDGTDPAEEKEKIFASGIYGWLEKSRSKVRSLQDPSIADEIEYPSFNSGPPIGGNTTDELISSLMKLFSLHPDLMRGVEEQIKLCLINLQLLQAFMKDLESLKLGSNLETSWLIEANETIDEATEIIDTVYRRANRRRWWLPNFSNSTARRKLKQDIMSVGIRISHLLETQERYGFKFVRQDLSKAALRSRLQQQTFQYHITDDVELSSAVNKIRNWLSQIPKMSDKLVSLVGSLSEELEDIHQLLKDKKVTGNASNFRKACCQQLKNMASEAEQYSETYAEDLEPKLLSAVTRIEDVVLRLRRCMKVYSIEVRADPCLIVGLEEDIHQLVLRLTDESANHSIISIVGMKGIGKTTLAKKVYNDIIVANHFEVRCWASIPEQEYYDENALLTSVGNQVLQTKEKQNGKDYWIKKVHDFLNHKRYLLVLDNVSSNEAMYALKAAFPELTNRSKIVLTARNKAIASNADRNCIPHQVRLRTREESWELFTQMMHGPCEIETLVKEAVERLGGGLPLAIIRLGYLLWGKKVTSGKLRALEFINQAQNKRLWLDNLEVNKEDLQFHPILTKCFSYFQPFSGNLEIPVRRIVASWIAQGLVQLRGDEILEDVAYEYLVELIGRNMIQVVQRESNGKVKTCCLPTTVQHLWSKGIGNSTKTRAWSSISATVEGQLVFHFADNDAGFHGFHGLSTHLPNVRQNETYPTEIIFFDTREGNRPGEEIGELLRCGIDCGFFQQLLVLDLEGVFRPQLPKTIGKLKKLTYLGLRWTYVETIPESIGNLEKLQTLDLKHTYVRTLPSLLWKLKKLRHLYLNQSSKLPEPTAISMKNLQSLSGVFVSKDSPLKDGLSKLNNLRNLRLAFDLDEPEQKVLAKSIVQLTHLQTLKLRSINNRGEPQNLKLERISDLVQLSNLYLLGKLVNQSIISELPQSLTELTLSASGIEEDPMPTLGKLPNLRSLFLYSGSYQGTDMVCFTQRFPLLLVLKLWHLVNLKKLDVQEGAMPKLRKLDIRSCSNLTIVDGLMHLWTLQECKLPPKDI